MALLQHAIGLFVHPLKDNIFNHKFPCYSFANSTLFNQKPRKTPHALRSLRMERFTRPPSIFLKKSPAQPKHFSESRRAGLAFSYYIGILDMYFLQNWIVICQRQASGNRLSKLRASRVAEEVEPDDEEKRGGNTSSESDGEDDEPFMDEEEREEWRRKIREVVNMNPEVKREVDPVERRKKIQKLLDDYPLVVEEEDPDWPEDADGQGFNLDQFFNKISIKNVKKDDDENDDSENEIVWRDDDYIRPIKDITIKEWEETVFKDISPLIILVHNRYRRPKENETVRDELEKAVHIIWNCHLPSPRCVAIDAVVELDLVSALHVSIFPELIFTKAGKILYREKALRTADELSKIMAFFYCGAAKPPCLNTIEKSEELIPTV